MSQTALERYRAAQAEIIALQSMSPARRQRIALADMPPWFVRRLALKREKYFAKSQDMPRRLAEKVWASNERIDLIVTYVHKRQKFIDDYEAQIREAFNQTHRAAD